MQFFFLSRLRLHFYHPVLFCFNNNCYRAHFYKRYENFSAGRHIGSRRPLEWAQQRFGLYVNIRIKWLDVSKKWHWSRQGTVLPGWNGYKTKKFSFKKQWHHVPIFSNIKWGNFEKFSAQFQFLHQLSMYLIVATKKIAF